MLPEHVTLICIGIDDEGYLAQMQQLTDATWGIASTSDHFWAPNTEMTKSNSWRRRAV